jgi:hypothetical protein
MVNAKRRVNTKQFKAFFAQIYRFHHVDHEYRIAEAQFVLGGLRNKLLIRHRQAAPVLASRDSLKRLLFHESNNSSARSVYNNAVGALVDNTDVANDLIIPIWLPWAPDKPYSLHHHLPMHAFAEPFVIEFPIPDLAELISTSIPIANITVAEPTVRTKSRFSEQTK